MKDFISFIKEIWKNERWRSVIIICFWILFFIICFSILNADKGNNLSSTKEQNLDNYEYSMILTINNLTYNIDGIRYDNRESLEIKELNKKYDDNFSNIVELYNLDLKYLRLEILKNYIETSLKEKEVTYNNGSRKEIYNINIGDFIISNSDNIIGEELISLEVTYKNNVIDNINIDLTNKMKKINKNITNYNIDITYFNIGNIKDFSN